MTTLFCSSAVRANQTWNGDSGTGGNGTWDMNTTPDWSGGVWTGGNDVADFTQTPGIVTVNNSTAGGAVTTSELYFKALAAGDYDITGGAVTTTGNSNTTVLLDKGNLANVTIDSALNISDTGTDEIANYSSGVLTVNGNQNVTTGNGNFEQVRYDAGASDAAGDAEIVINGTLAMGTTSAKIQFGEGGGSSTAVYELNANVSSLTNGVEVQNGLVLLGPDLVLGNNALTAFGPSTGKTGFLTEGAVAISQGLAANYETTDYFGGNTADISSFSGQLTAFNDSNAILTAAEGGRVNFTGDIRGEMPDGLVKTGLGTVVLGSSKGNDYTVGGTNNGSSPFTPGTVAADLQQGTTLITNTSGSAFGVSGVVTSSSPYATVNVESGATLGGNGISTQKVVAEAPGAIIAPGDAGQGNLGIAPAIQTLHLNGGLTAANGLTMDFKLDGATNDSIDFAGALVSLNGPITVNLTGSPVGNTTGGFFYLLTNIDANSTISSDITFTAPVGYTVEDYGTDIDPTVGGNGNYYYVELVAAPEPSTYALLGVGSLFLIGLARRRNTIAG